MSRFQTVTALLLLAVLAVAPAVASNLVLNFLMTALIVALAAQGWNLLAGFGGQFSFGHAAFFGMGAYTDAVLQARYGVNAWAASAAGVAARGGARMGNRRSGVPGAAARLLLRADHAGVRGGAADLRQCCAADRGRGRAAAEARRAGR